MSGLCYRVPLLFVCFCSCIFKVSICLQYYLRDVSYIIFVFSFCFCPEVVLIMVTFLFTGSKTCSRSLKHILFSTQKLALAKLKPRWQHSCLCTCPQRRHSGASCQSVTSTLLATTLQKWYVCLSVVIILLNTKMKNQLSLLLVLHCERLTKFLPRVYSLQLLWFSQWCNWGFWCHGM